MSDSPAKHLPRGAIDPSTLPYLLTVEELASLLRVTTKAIYCMVNRGEIPGVTRVRRRLRFLRDVVLEWIEESAR